EPITPRTLHAVNAKDGDETIEAMPMDMAEIRIPNPALRKRVSGLNVDVEGGASLAGVVNTSDKGKAGSDRISIFVSVKASARSGVVTYSYKDGDGKAHKGKVTIQIIKKKGDE